MFRDLIYYRAAVDDRSPRQIQEEFVKNKLELKPAAGMSYLRDRYGSPEAVGGTAPRPTVTARYRQDERELRNSSVR
jgi:hypothetical protein